MGKGCEHTILDDDDDDDDRSGGCAYMLSLSVKTLFFGRGHFVLQFLHRNVSSEGQN